MNENKLARLLFDLGNVYSNYAQITPEGAYFLKKAMDELRQQQAREDSLCSMVKEYQDKVDELRAEIERLNLVISNDTKYLNSDNEIMQKQQAEIEALKEKLEDSIEKYWELFSGEDY